MTLKTGSYHTTAEENTADRTPGDFKKFWSVSVPYSPFYQKWLCCSVIPGKFEPFVFSVSGLNLLKMIDPKPTEAQRYHCKHNFTTASIILPPRDLFYHREIYFNAASFILLPRVLYHCREFCFTAASFVLLPRVLSYLPRDLTWE